MDSQLYTASLPLIFLAYVTAAALLGHALERLATARPGTEAGA